MNGICWEHCLGGELTFTIDDQPIPFQDGQTIMEAARAAGVYIPHLCFNPEFAPHGGCRVCLVKVNGRARPPAQLPPPPVKWCRVRPRTCRKSALGILEMLFVEGNHICR